MVTLLDMSEAIVKESQCPLEHCMLSDADGYIGKCKRCGERLNALSSIVCFLTFNIYSGEFDQMRDVSQCPLEHCMLSDI